MRASKRHRGNKQVHTYSEVEWEIKYMRVREKETIWILKNRYGMNI